MKNPDSPLSQSITSHSSDPTIIKKSDRYTYHSRPCLSYFKKGVFSMQEGHVLKYRRAYSQIQKGPFFCLNTHALHSCGGKTNLHQDKILLPLTCLPFSPPLPLPLLIHTRPIPIPLSPLRYSPNLFICYPVSSRIQLVNSSPHQLVNLPVTPRTCSSVTLSPLATNLFPCPLVNPSTYNVTHRTCSSVTLSLLAYYLFPRLPVNSSIYNVTLRTCSPVTMSINTTNLFPCPLVNPSSCKLFLSSYFFVGTCPKHCNANSSLFVTHFYRQKNNYQ